ncbi:MAG: protein kinase [Candidatus Xenobiia bacterium LiM19]
MSEKCPECNRENNDGAQFCDDCGRVLSQTGTTKLTVLAGRYELLYIVKSGAMGSVYKAKDTRLNQTVALKKMLSSFSNPEDSAYAEKHFIKEAQMLSILHHGGLPKVIDYFIEKDIDSDKNAHYLVMTFIEGKDLETIIGARGKSPFTVAEVMDYFLQILDILHYLHTQSPPLIYRDLNPRNVMVSSGRIFLVDFGIARVFTPHEKGTAIGTPGYAPPEQYKGFAGPRSDLYSLGVMMHYLITGIDPESSTDTLFSFTPVRHVNPEAPEYLEKVIMSMVDLVPEKRPASADETSQMLRDGQEQPEPMLQIDAQRPGNTSSWTDVFASHAEKILQRLEKPVQAALSTAGMHISGGALRALVTGVSVCILLLVAIVIPSLLSQSLHHTSVKTAGTVPQPTVSASPKEPAVINDSDPAEDREQEIVDVLNENLRAAQEENLNRYMATIHEESANYESMRTQVKSIFETFDLSYEIKEMKIISSSPDMADVEFILVTRKINGPEIFNDNEMSGEYILKKSGGKWKIFSTIKKHVNYLNKVNVPAGY